MKKLTGSLPFRLLLGVVIGILVGQFASEGLMNIVVTLKYIMNQIISFCVPLIVIGFIAPSITKLGNNASKMLGVAVFLLLVQRCFPWQPVICSFHICLLYLRWMD